MTNSISNQSSIDPIRDSLAQVLRRLFRRIKERACSHRFALEDLRMVNRDGDLDRVAWPCDACGKNFSAHCGLDISPKHGPTFQRKGPELMKMLEGKDGR